MNRLHNKPKLKIHFCSDLHLEFGALTEPLPKGDVLVLAGDIVVAKYFDSTLDHPDRGEQMSRYNSFFSEAGEKFKRVFMIAGNHEFYGCEFSEAHSLLQRYIGNVKGYNIDYFRQGCVIEQGVLFILTTLWSDFEGHNPRSMKIVGQRLNDFKQIKKRSLDGNNLEYLRKFSPEDALDEFKSGLRFIRNCLFEHPELPTVVVTHHCPSPEMLNRFLTSLGLDGGFASDLHNFIEQHPQIQSWICGHTHVCREVKVGRTLIRANCRGYVGKERLARNFAFQSFEVEGPSKKPH